MPPALLPIQSRPRPGVLALPSPPIARPSTQHDRRHDLDTGSTAVHPTPATPKLLLTAIERRSSHTQRSTTRVRRQVRPSNVEQARP